MKDVCKIFTLAVIGVVALTLVGCSGTIPVNYVPHNIVRYQGNVNVGKFRYEPAQAGTVKDNQVQNTAAGSIYLPVDIADLARRATALELEKTGFQLDSRSNLGLKGTVLEFKADDLGYSVDWTYSIRYVITNRTTGQQLLSKEYAADPVTTGKFGKASDYTSSINNLILSAYNKFIRDPAVRSVLSPKNSKLAVDAE